jgi:hypothetical protein
MGLICEESVTTSIVAIATLIRGPVIVTDLTFAILRLRADRQ